jgi:hypothetical protein
MLNYVDKKTVESAYNEALNTTLGNLKAKTDLMYLFTYMYLPKFRSNILNIMGAFEESVPVFEDAEGNREKLYENVSLRVAMQSDEVIDITVSGNIDAKNTFKKKFSVVRTVGSNSSTIFDDVVNNLYPLYVQLLEDTLVRMNLKRVNEVFAEITKKAGLDYTVKFASGFSTDKVVQEITDNSIVFTLSEDKKFDLDSVIVLMDPNAIVDADRIEKARNETAEAFASSPTPVKFLDAKYPLIKLLAGVSGRIKTMTYIRKVTGRNAMSTTKASRCLTYYDANEVYSLVEFTDDGLEVVLSPFNAKTFDAVDFDVKAAIESSDRYNA